MSLWVSSGRREQLCWAPSSTPWVSGWNDTVCSKRKSKNGVLDPALAPAPAPAPAPVSASLTLVFALAVYANTHVLTRTHTLTYTRMDLQSSPRTPHVLTDTSQVDSHMYTQTQAMQTHTHTHYMYVQSRPSRCEYVHTNAGQANTHTLHVRTRDARQTRTCTSSTGEVRTHTLYVRTDAVRQTRTSLYVHTHTKKFCIALFPTKIAPM